MPAEERATLDDQDADDRPEISVCEREGDTVVFLEADNTDGWIASDLTVDCEH
jgi:hypothetical protein